MRTKVVTGSLILVFAMFIQTQQGNAQGEPRGWRCEYRIFEGTSDSPRLYNCYGRSLNSTRARAKVRCRGNPLCNAGACLPLEFTPRNTSSRY